MAATKTENIRNMALVGHSGAGKTTLIESLAHFAGLTERPGRVEDGATISDFEDEEKTHGISLSTSLISLEYRGLKVNVLDTPGYSDFGFEVDAALDAVGAAVIVISAADGIEVGTKIAFRKARARGLPILFFINKCDRENTDPLGLVAKLRSEFGQGIAPLQLPISQGGAFEGVVDLLSDHAFIYPAPRPGVRPTAPAPTSVPEEISSLEHDLHDTLVEGIVVADDEQMTRYLEGESLSFEELEHTLATGVANGEVFPVLMGSATTYVGLDQLLLHLEELTPPATARAFEARAGDTSIMIAGDPSQKALLKVVKTINDPYVGRVSLARVVTGTLKPDTELLNTRTRQNERPHQLMSMSGQKQTRLESAVAGDFVALPKLAHTLTGDTLSEPGTPVELAISAPAPPTYRLAIAVDSAADDDKLMTALYRLQESDPSLVVERDSETHQLMLAGQGDTHLKVTLERLKTRFGVHVHAEELRIKYRESISRPATAEGKYKKQSGGHGQFGVCTLALEPLERNQGFEFVDEIVGGVIPRQFIPAVEKGAVEASEAGGIHGYPVVDIRVRCTDGKHHPVDSSEMSFKMAGSLALREALSKAGPVVLEPISRLVVTVPADLQGDVMSDMSSRRGRVQGTEMGNHGMQVITALVPTSEITRYAIDLKSLTSGEGSFAIEHDHYEIAPDSVASKLPKVHDHS